MVMKVSQAYKTDYAPDKDITFATRANFSNFKCDFLLFLMFLSTGHTEM